MKKQGSINRAIRQRNKRCGIRVKGITHNIKHLGMCAGSHLFGTPRQGRGTSRQPVGKRDRGFNFYSISGGGSYTKHKIPVKHKGKYVYAEVRK